MTMHPTPPTIPALVLAAALLCPPLASHAQQRAEALDTGATRRGLSVKPPRNLVKATGTEVVERRYERRAVKGLTVETGSAAVAPSPTAAPQEYIDVEVVKVKDSEGVTTEVVRPYVPLPILFVVNSDNLLDETSRTNVDAMAHILKDLGETEKAIFQIQGHTSAEGTREANQGLSDRRAARIHSLLLAKGVEARTLSAIGLGEDAARASENAPEQERQQDRRVLIVRMK